MSTTPTIVHFSQQATAPEYDHPREERRLQGNPLRTTWNHFTNASGEVYAGVWGCEPGSWRIAFGPDEDEFFFVTEGRCRVIDEAGHAVEAGPGESLVIPAGFKGVFEVLEPMKKHYVIVERKPAA
ncbi:cupin domain-containing protein [Chitinimonas koreensis]|uniref:cupin domain-containing protein n=1 Tax=Chitinimonas koreensis TaxID=356302 RepID=UPI00042775F8|nr:cupin domain-containing protein [Chitinimonas koreensis]QNM97917.1 cupin domain-containing protein [Chitinimonas koreensis]